MPGRFRRFAESRALEKLLWSWRSRVDIKAMGEAATSQLGCPKFHVRGIRT